MKTKTDIERNQNNETLNGFLNRIKAAENLTFDDLEGSIDGPEDVDCYIENAINNIFLDTAKELGWSFEELQAWHKKNWI